MAFSTWTASGLLSDSRHLFPSSLRGRAVSFLWKALLFMLALTVVPWIFVHLSTLYGSERAKVWMLVAIQCTLLGFEDRSWVSGCESHCTVISHAFCVCLSYHIKNRHYLPSLHAQFSFKRELVLFLNQKSTYCQGRIETVILIWHRHLFLPSREVLKAERRFGITHSFH